MTVADIVEWAAAAVSIASPAAVVLALIFAIIGADSNVRVARQRPRGLENSQ